MVVIQHTLTQLYLQSFADWSAEWNDAWAFHDMSEAVGFCELWGLKDVQIIVAEGQDVHELALPVRRPGIPLHLVKVVPVVLPRTDSRPN
jgi:hypothetical protein